MKSDEYMRNIRDKFDYLMNDVTMAEHEAEYLARVDYGVIQNKGEDRSGFVERWWLAFVKKEYGVKDVDELKANLEKQANTPTDVVVKKQKPMPKIKTEREILLDNMLESNPFKGGSYLFALYEALARCTVRNPGGTHMTEITRAANTVAKEYPRRKGNKKPNWSHTMIRIRQEIKKLLAQNQSNFEVMKVIDQEYAGTGTQYLYKLEKVGASCK